MEYRQISGEFGIFQRGRGHRGGGARQKFYNVDYYVEWKIRSQQLLKFSSAINKVDLSITRKSNDCYFSIISNFLCQETYLHYFIIRQ